MTIDIDPRLREHGLLPDRAAENSSYPYTTAPKLEQDSTTYAVNHAHQVSPHSQHLDQAIGGPSSLPTSSLPYYGAQEQHIDNGDPQFRAAGGYADGMLSADGDTSKRPRACEACRGLKVKCDFDGDADICKRCAKAGRECIVTAPNRRRPKKTDSRVADLEKRVEDLTASLQEQQRQTAKRLAADSLYGDGFWNGLPTESHTEPARKKRKSSSENASFALANGALAGLNEATQAPTTLRLPLYNEYADVIDRGLLSHSDAGKIYEHYKINMAKHLPAVVFPSTMTVGGLRKSKPVLFLAILSVASGHEFQTLQRPLTREAMKALAERVMCKAEKSLELVQAMQVLSIWHCSEDQNDTQTFQLAQCASTMAIAMELGGPPLKGNLGIALLNGSTKVSTDHNSPETRRTWLSCYTLSGSTSLPLRQTNLIRWSHFLERTLQLLESSPEVSVTDKALCQWARLQRIMDQAAELASVATSLPFDPNKEQLRQRVQNMVDEAKAFIKAVGTEPSYSLKLAAHEVAIYCNLIATKIEEITDRDSNPQTPGQPSERRRKLNNHCSKAMKACATSIQDLLDSFIEYLKSTAQIDLNSLPNFHFARIAYALVALLCMHFAASTRLPGSKVNAALDPNDLKVAEYLTRLLELLRSTAADETKRPVQKFQLIVRMLNTWYQRRKDGRKSPLKNELSEVLSLDPQPIDEERNTPRLGYRKLSLHGSRSAEEDEFSVKKSPQNIAPQAPMQGANLTAGNTGLDLLSQVATNAPSAHGSQGTEWYDNSTAYQPYQQPYSVEVDHGATVAAVDECYEPLTIDPNLEEAMYMAFGSEGNMFPTFAGTIGDFFSPMQGQDANYGWLPGLVGQ